MTDCQLTCRDRLSGYLSVYPPKSCFRVESESVFASRVSKFNTQQNHPSKCPEKKEREGQGEREMGEGKGKVGVERERGKGNWRRWKEGGRG